MAIAERDYFTTQALNNLILISPPMWEYIPMVLAIYVYRLQNFMLGFNMALSAGEPMLFVLRLVEN